MAKRPQSGEVDMASDRKIWIQYAARAHQRQPRRSFRIVFYGPAAARTRLKTALWKAPQPDPQVSPNRHGSKHILKSSSRRPSELILRLRLGGTPFWDPLGGFPRPLQTDPYIAKYAWIPQPGPARSSQEMILYRFLRSPV